MLQHDDDDAEWIIRRFEADVACSSPADNIESFEQTYAIDAEEPSADNSMRPYTFSFKHAIGIRNIFMSLFTLVVAFLVPAMMRTAVQAVTQEKRDRDMLVLLLPP